MLATATSCRASSRGGGPAGWVPRIVSVGGGAAPRRTDGLGVGAFDGAGVVLLEATAGLGAVLTIGPPSPTFAGPVTTFCSVLGAGGVARGDTGETFSIFVPCGGPASRFGEVDTEEAFSALARNCAGGFV